MTQRTYHGREVLVRVKICCDDGINDTCMYYLNSFMRWIFHMSSNNTAGWSSAKPLAFLTALQWGRKMRSNHCLVVLRSAQWFAVTVNTHFAARGDFLQSTFKQCALFESGLSLTLLGPVSVAAMSITTSPTPSPLAAGATWLWPSPMGSLIINEPLLVFATHMSGM